MIEFVKKIINLIKGILSNEINTTIIKNVDNRNGNIQINGVLSVIF